MSKIVQIAVTGTEDADMVYALQEDGTVLCCVYRHNEQGPWLQLRSPAGTEPLADQHIPD